MSNLTEDSNNWWSLHYREKIYSNAQYCNGFVTRTLTDADPGCDKHVLKQKILEHEETFKNQVLELHRLYRTQRDMMVNLSYAKPTVCGTEIVNSPLSSSKVCQVLEARPSKVRRKFFDLNEPAQLEETPLLPVEFLGYGCNHNESRSVNSSAKSNPAFMNFAREKNTWNPHRTCPNGSLSSLYVDTRSKERDWLSSTYETGNNKGSLAHRVETFRGNLEKSSYAYGRQHVTSQMTRTPYPFASSSEFTNSWSHTLSSWVKPSGFATNPSLNSSTMVSKSPQTAHTHVSLENKWKFHCGSASGSKEPPVRFPVPNLDSLKHKKGDNFKSDSCFNNGRAEFVVISDNMDVVSKKGFDLNVLSQNEELFGSDLELLDKKREPQDYAPALAWYKAKPRFGNESTDSMKDGNSPVFGETRSIRKIKEVPTPESPCASKNESSLLGAASATHRSSPKGENSGHEARNIVIDINIACDLSMVELDKEPVVAEKVVEKKATMIRNSFDLNSCITEDEDPISIESYNNVHVRTTLVEIDLEAPPPILENEHDNLSEEKDKQNEAAEAIVAISSCIFIDKNSSDPADDALGSLGWFVDVVFSFNDEVESKSKEIIAKEMDYFEAMTLQLKETKEQDYMPEPFVLEVQAVEDVGSTLATKRTRRGRGKQRRDFQREILPGMASLSRHEMTEDLQTFGELMRATGHSWNSGLTRRNGGTRGRRKKVTETSPVTVSTSMSPPIMQKLSKSESILDDKSLIGWGKTTRRPRRQRCPAPHRPNESLSRGTSR